ncbi:MAG: 3'-5' exoribonuclease YhaM family protein [bacterium]
MIRDIKPGDKVIAFFVLRRKELKSKKGSNEPYLSLELGDASGRVSATLWENARTGFEAVEKGDIVKVKANAIHFKQRLHLNVEKIRKAEKSDDFDLKQLLAVVEKDRDLLLSQLDSHIKSVDNPFLKKLLHEIFHDDTIRAQFKDAPGGKLWHHNYIGGLLEHTLSVTDISLKVSEVVPEGNRDLLVAGGLLHDIGKIKTFSYHTLIDYTDEGRLVGHIVLGEQIVCEKIKRIPDFPKDLENQIIHLILSHQGKLEQASPVVPMTLEGLILYYADELDSKANAFLRIRSKEMTNEVKWSSFVKLLDRYLYFGNEQKK